MINKSIFSDIKNENLNSTISSKQRLEQDQKKLNKTLQQSKKLQAKKLNQLILFWPQQILFSSSSVDSQIKELFIQNVSSLPLKVKISKPITSNFQILSTETNQENQMLCPGLTKKVEIQFKKKAKVNTTTKNLLSKTKQSNDSYYDTIKIVLQNKKYEVNLKAIKSKPQIQYENFINLNFVDMNKLIKLIKPMKNKSNETVKIRIVKQSWQNMHISPTQFFLKPMSNQMIQFSVTPTSIGAFHHKILIEANGECRQPIEIIYSTFDYNYSIVDEQGNKLTQIDFGYMFYGTKKSIRLFAVNNSPNCVQMKGKIRTGWKTNPLESIFQSPQEFGQECSSTIVQMTPKSIKLKPFGKEQFWLNSYREVTQDQLQKVNKYSKDLKIQSSSKFKTHKRIMQLHQKYKIQDDEYHQSFVSQFNIITNQPNILKTCFNLDNQARTSGYNSSLITQLKMIYGLPAIKIQPAQFQLGKTIIGKPISRTIKIKSLNQQLPIKIKFNKTLGVQTFPKQEIIASNQFKEFQIYLTPVNLGPVSDFLSFQVNDNYKFDCKISYQGISDKSLMRINKITNKISHKSLHFQNSLSKTQQQLNFTKTLDNFQKTCHNQVYRYKKNAHSSTHTSAFKIKKNISSSNLRQSKQVPYTDNFGNLMPGLMRTNHQKNQSGSFSDFQQQNQKKKNNKIDQSQIDDLIEYCDDIVLKDKSLKGLPNTKDNLFVTKKIDKYQPYTLNRNTRKLLKSKASKDFFSNAIKRAPRNRKQADEIATQLDGQALKLIGINTKIINFGKMFVGSKMIKEFIVQNGTEYSIQVKLKSFEEETQLQKIQYVMLSQTDFQQQIISPHSAGNFKIVLFAKQCGKFQKPITYTINKVHEFQFLVQAQIQLATLAVNKNNLKLAYQDDISQMFLKDNFILKNDGNAATQFNITQLQKNFIIQPSQGIVQPGESAFINVIYNSPNPNVINAGQPISTIRQLSNKTSTPNQYILIDERINVQIKNGVSLSLRATSSPNLIQPKCFIKENKINFGVTIVGKAKSKSFLLRNTGRNMVLFEIQNNQSSEYLFFQTTKGKLPPQSSKQITVTYKSSIIQSVSAHFKVIIRGGLVINVPMSAQSVAPNIHIIEDDFNFGDVCCGTVSVKPVTISNQSETMVELLLDLVDRRAHGMEYLYVSFVGNQNHTIVNNNHEQNDLNKQLTLKNKISNQGAGSSSHKSNQNYFSQDESIIDNAHIQPQIHKLKVPPKSNLTFYILFKPKLPGFYQFQLPIYLENFIKNDSLTKVVTCFATQPKFIIEPSVVKFKKKIINDKQSTSFHPLIQFITLKNPGDKQLKWKIDYPNNQKLHQGGSSKSFGTSGSILANSSNNMSLMSNPKSMSCQKFCFQIQNKKGQVKPASWECINISFNPYQAGVYCYKLPLLIYNQQRGLYQQQAQIRLQGQGQYPSIFFDRKQLIMPVVPLGIQSVGMFKIINQGYESLNIKHRIQIFDLQGNCIIQGTNLYTSGTPVGIPQINIIYPQGTKMGVNKKQLYVIVKFISKKPISFTCKLQLFDNVRDSRVYSLPISGTCDNSIMTIFPYLNDPDNRYKYNPNLLNGQNTPQQKHKSGVFQNYTINLQSTDERNIIDKLHNQYEKMNANFYVLDCQIIRRWMNSFLKDQKIGKFPEDVINSPDNLLRMLSKMTSKKQFDTLLQVYYTDHIQNSSTIVNKPNQTVNRPNLTATLSGNAFSQILAVPQEINSKVELYEYLIKLLKSMGCLLNHIRPYFLLGKEQFFSQMQKDSNWKNMSENYTKQYRLLHLESWIILFYQIINHFWYNSSKLKTLFSSNEKTLSVTYPSNIYSQTELSVLKWIKSIYQKYNQFQDSHFKFLSFGQDFKDCLGPIFAIYHHIINPTKKKKSLEGLSKKPNTSNELQNNVKILYQLFQKTGLIPLIFEDQYLQIKQKEMFLFLYQLYQLLPQQLPKSDPILFPCNLGQKCCKYVQIKNPSNKIVHYWIKLQGSKDFYHEQKDFIKIQPKAIYKFKVIFQSRISQEQTAYLTFLNKLQTETANSSVAGTTLVFQLKSKILGRKSIKKIQPIHCQIYETQTIRIPVQNYFEEYQFGNFDITLVQQVIDGNEQPSKVKLFPLKKSSLQAMTQSSQQSFQGNNQRQKKPKGQQNTTKILGSIQEPQFINFFVDTQSIKIKRKTISYLELMFNPIVLKKIRCYIIFHDPAAGEFQYQIIGMPEIPKILHQIRYPTTLYTGTKEVIEVNLPVYNNYMIKSNVLMEQKLYSKNGRNKTSKKQEKDVQIFKIQINMDQKILQYVTFPSEHVIKNAKKQQSNAVDLINKIKIQCYFPVVIKDLNLDFLLINQDRRDIRRIKVGLNLASKPIQSDLIISTTARVPIIQPIPIQNTSNKDWRVKATLVEQQDDQGFQYFSLKQGQRLSSKDFIVKKNLHTQVNTSNNLNNNSSLLLNQSTNVQLLSLVFNPQWTCKTQCRLTIQNVTTNQQLVYFIKGICEQPISEEHIYIKMQTATSFTKTIKIKNPYGEALNYTVETDLEQLKINNHIYMQANQEMNFKIQAFSKQATNLIGFLKFTDDYNRFFWYTITIEAYDNNHYQQTIELSSTVQRQIQRIIQVKNPTNMPISFKVDLNQKLGLTGQQKFNIQASSSYFYKLKYKPKMAIKKIQTQLKFFNKTLGCYIYQVILSCQQNQKRKIQTMNTQVGKVGQLELDIQNNLSTPIQIRCQISNTKYFQVKYNEFLQAQSENALKVIFKPIQQGQQNCILKVYGDQFQTKCYEIQGNGLAPFSIQTIQFKTQLYQPLLQVIKFKNPNPKNGKERVKIILQDIQTKHNAFKIVEQAQTNIWQTQVKDILGIPIEFVPNQKGCFESMLIIQCFHYQWKYLLKGLTNTKIQNVAKDKIQTECRKESIKIIKIPVPDYIKKQNKFDLSELDKVEIQHSNQNILKNIKSWTGLRLQTGFKEHEAMLNKYSSQTKIQISSSQVFPLQKEQILQTKKNLQQDEITLYVKFLPQKPMDETVNLVIYNSKNEITRINYKLRFVVHPSKPDKMLKLQINSIKKHKFEINIDQLQLLNLKTIKKNMLSLFECKMEKKEFVDCKFKENSSIIQINFSPNNLTFTKNKQYSDVLMLSNDKNFWSFEVMFKLINGKNKK